MYLYDNISGFLIWNGDIMENINDYTFAKKFVLDGAKIGIVCSEECGSGGTPIKWMRFPCIEYNSYLYCDYNVW